MRKDVLEAVGAAPVERAVYVNKKRVAEYKAIVDPKTGGIHAIMSDDYSLIPHRDVLETVMAHLDAALGENNYTVKVWTSGKDGLPTRMFADFYTHEFEIEGSPQVGDIVRAGFRITNSYDGSMGLNIFGRTLRLVCENGATVPHALLGLKRKHLGELGGVFERALDTVIEKIVLIKDAYEALTQIELPRDAAVELIEKLNPNFVPKKLKELAIAQLPAEPVVRGWDVYNAATYAATHFKGADKVDYWRRDDIDKTVAALLVTIPQTAGRF
jgi:hypothetical protein